MSASLTIALATGQTGFVPDNSGQVREELTVTGSSSVANDTGTYTTIMKQPQRIEGGSFTASFSGQVMTLTDHAGIGSGVTGISVYGYA